MPTSVPTQIISSSVSESDVGGQAAVQVKNVSRLGHAKPIVTVNGMYPGPTIYAREGDRVMVKVTNHAQYKMSIHWHGLKQYRNGWADGPAYITQCPIQTGNSYAYDFNITGQRGTLWWHAHISWLRATVYGAIVIMPIEGTPYPFPQPHMEANLILGEWWNADVETLLKKGDQKGLPPNISDAHTINGKPGPLFTCSEKRRFRGWVLERGVLERGVFRVGFGEGLLKGERQAVSGLGSGKRGCQGGFREGAVRLGMGVGWTVVVGKVRGGSGGGDEERGQKEVVDNKTATAIFQYKGVPNTIIPSLPQLPSPNDTSFALSYNRKLRSLNTPQFPAKTALLQAHYFNMSGVFRTDFWDKPPTSFNYTGAPLTANLRTVQSAMPRISKIAFNSTVELVLQDSNLLSVESHPFHLHGYNFFVVGTGVGNFDPIKDAAKLNLVDPPERNTVGVPPGGWTAIRFRADNPGVWFMHCHLELHTGWGLKIAFMVEDGPGPEYSVLPPPKNLPHC
uniref:Laccase n=1 Tax=Chenopodium quinoa TaxID=63459 RepID=A0A803MU20_CHEQI